ncbi:MAG: hypothetical protein GEV10_07165 [Streptosporangiales bacterium]|nr:hypothetical protein [Streptosporangiales bacterium]
MTAGGRPPTTGPDRSSVHRPASGRRVGMLLALGVFLLAPITAEYLTGYDNTVGQPLELLGGLLILGPLYGAPALIIREVVRRTGRGWPSILLLGLAFGVVQAGLVDQSLFNTSYRDIDYWDDMMWPTYIPVLGISAYNAMTFLMGHMVSSIGAPIAVVESLAPRRRTTPWLGPIGLGVAGLLYVAASVLVYDDHVKTEQFHASAGQLVGATAVVVGLVVTAFLVGRRPRPRVDRRVPPAWLAGVLSAVALNGAVMLAPTWLAVAVTLVPTAGLAVLVARWSRSDRWSPGHVLALAAGALLAQAAVAFTVDPLGDVALVLKLAHNVILGLGVAGLITAGALALRRSRRGSCPEAPGRDRADA